MSQANQKIVEKIISNGVKSLKEFGYPDVNVGNILTDEVYKMFFKKLLQDNLGSQFDTEINYLIDKIGD